MAEFRSVQRVYFDDLDALNILHNVRFLLFMERARGEFFNTLGFRWQESSETNPDKFHVVAAHDIQYLAPVRGEGEIAIEIAIDKVGTTSLTLAASITSIDGKVTYAHGHSRLVRLDENTFKPCAWSERFRAAIAPYIRG